jgi:hypothetical protein
MSVPDYTRGTPTLDQVQAWANGTSIRAGLLDRDAVQAVMEARIGLSRMVLELVKEAEALRQHSAELVAGRIDIREMVIKNGQFNVKLGGDGPTVLACALVEMYRTSEATNYLEMGVADPKTGERFAVTVQRLDGKTPHELRREAEEARDAAVGVAARAVPMVHEMADAFTDDEWSRYESLRNALEQITKTGVPALPPAPGETAGTTHASASPRWAHALTPADVALLDWLESRVCDAMSGRGTAEDRLASDVYQVLHWVSTPGCRKNHPDWGKIPNAHASPTTPEGDRHGR